MDVLARGYRCVTFENDPVQFKATAVLIPQLELVDESHLVTPLQEVHASSAWKSTKTIFFLIGLNQDLVNMNRLERLPTLPYSLKFKYWFDSFLILQILRRYEDLSSQTTK